MTESAREDRPALADPFVRWSWRHFRRPAGPRTAERIRPLEAADLPFAPDEFEAFRRGVVAVVSVAASAIAVALLAVTGRLDSPLAWAVAALVAIAGPIAASLALDLWPIVRARSRARAIDQELRSVFAFLSAMASADVPVDGIVRALAQESAAYGTVAREAGKIVRDIDLLGADILSALSAAARRSPSRRLEALWDGIVTTARGGGELKHYFLETARSYEREAPIREAKATESLAFAAEAYVILVVAFPLFLLLLFAVFATLGGAGGAYVGLVVGIGVGAVPIAQLAFVLGLSHVGRPEGAW